MAQVSGLRATYDINRPIGARLVTLEVGGQPVEDGKIYRVATNSFLGEGGDGYLSFKQGREVARDKLLSELLCDHVSAVKTIEPPAMGRLVSV